MTVFLEEIGLFAYDTTWECADDIGAIPPDHAALLNVQSEDVVRLTDDQFGNARWTTWQALDLHSVCFHWNVPQHPASRPWRQLANEYYRDRGGNRDLVRGEIHQRQQELEVRTRGALDRLRPFSDNPGFPQGQDEPTEGSDAVIRETIEKADEGQTDVDSGMKQESEGEGTGDEGTEGEEDDFEDVKGPRKTAKQEVDKRFRSAAKGPRCKSCKESKKGCDGKQPCGRCEQVGRVCVPHKS